MKTTADSTTKLYKLIRAVIIVWVVIILIKLTLFFFVQRIGTSSTLDEEREFMIHFMKGDSMKYAAFEKTDDFNRFKQAQSSDTLSKYLKIYSAFKPDSTEIKK